MKKCSKCRQVKPVSEFYKDNHNKSGLRGSCKECDSFRMQKYYKNNQVKHNKISREYNKNNAKKIKEQRAKHYKYNRVKILESQKERRKNNPEKMKESHAKYYNANREEVKEKQAKYRKDNPKKIKEMSTRYYENNAEKIIEKSKVYYQNNIEKVNKYKNKYRIEKGKTDPIFKLKRDIRNLIRCSFKRIGWTKKSRTQDILGCTFEFFKQHMEARFAEGMTIENHGKWHIDHRVPLATAETKEDIIRLCHYSNLQPLWAIDNLSKGAKILK